MSVMEDGQGREEEGRGIVHGDKGSWTRGARAKEEDEETKRGDGNREEGKGVGKGALLTGKVLRGRNFVW